MATKTVKQLAKAIRRADIGMNADSDDYLRLAKELRPHLVEFFGEAIVDDTDQVPGTLYVCVPKVYRYNIPMAAKNFEQAMELAENHARTSFNAGEINKYLAGSHMGWDEASYDWDSHE
jgi:hypothetical protein